MAASEREFDVVVFGASGVTGRRVAAYLERRAPETGARWAAAGRDTARLEAVLREEGLTELPELIEADVGDPASLQALAARTRVVLNLVGPYTLYGEPVIAACIGAGTHYLDLTGEIPHVARMIERYGEAAESAGVKVVPVSGFESLPADLSVAIARDRLGVPPVSAELHVRMQQPPGLPKRHDIISGGTFQSVTEAIADPAAGELSDPASLAPPGADREAIRAASPIRISPWTAADGSSVGPMLPAPFINPPVIQRAHAILNAREGLEGPQLRYREGVALGGRGGGPLRLARLAAVGAMSGTQAAVSGIGKAPEPVRRRLSNAMRRFGPSSGFGPDRDRLELFRWQMKTVATDAVGRTATVELDAVGQPGYLTTARMLGEAGLILADDEAPVPEAAGFLTPATALGTAVADRFAAAGMRFT